METVLISLSCFGQMCNEMDLVQSSENLNEPPSAQNIEVYRDLSEEATKFTTGECYMFNLRRMQSHSQISLQGRLQNMETLLQSSFLVTERPHVILLNNQN